MQKKRASESSVLTKISNGYIHDAPVLEGTYTNLYTMTKILFSLLTILTTSSLVFGLSNAYFADSEKSTGNTFTSGAIDLRVDSQGHYNGLECIDNTWQDCTQTVPGPELLTNGGFEEPVVATAQKWNIYPDGTAGLGWTVAWATNEPSYSGTPRPSPALQEMHRGVNGWLPAVGDQYTELDSDWDGPAGSLTNEPALVEISQVVNTTPGASYTLHYQYSPRPNTSASQNQLSVYVDADLVNSHSSAGGANTIWTAYNVNFSATGATATVKFVGGGASDSLGIFLDDVSVKENIRQCTPSEEFTEECSSTWELTDLGTENTFFSFADLKPGDRGENTISLHVDNNDAFVCLYTDNYKDVEVAPPSEAETEALDPHTTPGEPGEISKYVNFIAWYDDGDNIWEPDENLFTGENPVPASTFLNQSTELFSTGTAGALATGETKYIGVAWCFGTMTVDTVAHTWNCDGSTATFNDAQTDAITADIGFYAEQTRNNETFSCPVIEN